MLTKIITLAVLAVGACQSTAMAADCGPLQMLNTVKLEAVEGGNVVLVPVTVNGAPQKLLLDTGGSITQISRTNAKALGLSEQSSNTRLFDAYGNVSDSFVFVKSLIVGRMEARGRNFQISPHSDLEQRRGAAGLLSTDLFSNYDIDLDFGANRFNYFSPDHCEGRVTYWTERPLAVIPMKLQSSQVTVPVIVDGQAITAIVDTGATVTVMSAGVAKRYFGLIPGSPDLPEMQSDPDLPVYKHQFAKLSFEGVEVLNPRIGVVPDRMGSKDRYNTNLLGSRAMHRNDDVRLPDLIIGMNVLKHLHLYIAYKEGKLYVTPAGSGESVLFKATTPPQ